MIDDIEFLDYIQLLLFISYFTLFDSEKENMVVSKCAALETMEQNCISLQEEVTNLSRNAKTNETELNVLRQNDQEKDAALVTLQRNNRQLQIENDQLVQNFRNEQMKVEMLLQTLSSTLHPFKHVSFPLHNADVNAFRSTFEIKLIIFFN